MDDESVTNADRRRAAVLLAHFAAGDVAGVGAVLAETAEAGGLSGLVAGLVSTILEIAPPLRTPEGVELLRTIALCYAKHEGAPHD